MPRRNRLSIEDAIAASIANVARSTNGTPRQDASVPVRASSRRRTREQLEAEDIPLPETNSVLDEDFSDDEEPTTGAINVNGTSDIAEDDGDEERRIMEVPLVVETVAAAPPEYMLIYDVRIGAMFTPPLGTIFAPPLSLISFTRCIDAENAKNVPPFQFSTFVNLDPHILLESIIRPLWEHAVHYTNLGIAQNGNKIRKTSYAELKTLFGMHEVMSSWTHNPIEDYFSESDEYVRGIKKPNFSDYMSLSRYRELNQALRFADYGTTIPAVRTANKAWKVAPLVDIAKSIIRTINPFPGEVISGDESMMLFKGLYCPIIRAMPNKPIDRGAKFYVLVDYETFVPCALNLCNGVYNAENCAHLPYGSAGFQMMRLFSELPGEGYHFIVDNYYGSDTLARVVYTDLRSYLTATVRKDRLPLNTMCFSNAKKARPTRNCPKYSIKAFTSWDGMVSTYAWMDTAAVYFISTKRHPNETKVISRQNSDGDGRHNVSVPTAIADYTNGYHGVDGIDQLTAGEYSIEGRGQGQRIRKWTVRMFYWFENLFAQIAYNIHNYHNSIGKLTRVHLKHGDFNRDIGDNFLNNDAFAAERAAKRRKRVHKATLTSSPLVAPVSPISTLSSGTSGNRNTTDACVPLHSLAMGFSIGVKANGKDNAYKRTPRGECVHCPSQVVQYHKINGRPIVLNGRVQTKKNHSRRTNFFCTSNICSTDRSTCWLHPQCFAQFHMDHKLNLF